MVKWLIISGATLQFVGAIVFVFPDLSHEQLRRSVYSSVPRIRLVHEARTRLTDNGGNLHYRDDEGLIRAILPLLFDEFHLTEEIEPRDINEITVGRNFVDIKKRTGDTHGAKNIPNPDRRIDQCVDRRIRQIFVRTGVPIFALGTLLVIAGAV